MRRARKQRKLLLGKRSAFRRQHPVAIVRYLTKSFWILLIPAVRGLIAYSFNLVYWMRVMWSDILVIAFFFTYALLRWLLLTYKPTDKSLIYTSGFIVRTVSEIPYANISAANTEKHWWQYPLRCCYMLIDTDAKSLGVKKTSPDLKLLIRDEDAEIIFAMCRKFTENGTKFSSELSKGSLVAFSLLFSSAFSGVALLTALLINAGDILGDTLNKTIFNALDSAAKTVNSRTLDILSKLPAAAVYLAIIILVGWFVSFVGNLLRHMHFTFEKDGGAVTIKDGFFTARNYFINRDHINYADLRQNLLMKLFGVMSVNVSCSGYGKAKNEIPVFIPISDSRKVRSILKRILPDFNREADTIPLKFRYILIYIGPPAAALNIISAAAGILIYLFKDWYDMIFSTMLMLEIPIIWLLIVKTAAFCTSGISYSGSVICIKYCRGFGFHTILVPENRIAKITVSRTIFQRMNGSCDIIVYTNSEYTRSHRVRGVSYKDALLIFNKYLIAKPSETARH